MNAFLLCFIPLFVAVDAVGVLPLFMSLSSDLDRAALRQVVLRSCLIALSTGLVFFAAGNPILRMLGISIADFMAAGGALLFVMALTMLLGFEKRRRISGDEEISAVPVGVPLIVGPSVITTGMLLVDQHGFAVTAVALTANIIIEGIVFAASSLINGILGKSGVQVVSKLAALLLAAYGVMMMRRGVTAWLSGTPF